jgi:hypothetical protein
LNTIPTELAAAVQRLGFLDDLSGHLAFPMTATVGVDSYLPPLYELYGEAQANEHESATPHVVLLARRLSAFVEAEGALDDESAARLVRRIHGTRFPPALGNLGDIIWRRAVQERALIYDLAFVLNEGVGARALIESARNGNEDALLKLVKVDKSILGAPWAAAYLEQRQYAGDWAFFKRLGDRVRRCPINKGSGYAREVLIVALFWEEHFRHCTLEEIVALLKPYFPALDGAVDYGPFRKQLNRAGLKKPRHNRKVGQIE